MIKCKIRPNRNICSECYEENNNINTVPKCKECDLNNIEYTIVSIKHNLWKDDYAVVLHNGLLETVSINRIYECKEK